MCCMTEEVCGALPAEATRSGARESPWRPHASACAKYFLAPPQPACVLPPSALSARHMLDQ